MNYVTLWLTVYINPAPQWGFIATLQRGLMDSLLTYLPVYLMGRIPPTLEKPVALTTFGRNKLTTLGRS